ncbi:nicotinate-nucleotide--dimethylbenzimidazole phosphoribosyltransferase [Fodinicola acaciae]|uniref:nicotinate-nucleotide--dimethylbenzimidazole phosphoribosyltransferase n=1 Tax=Fodinicola acaciae TaxID=2681555 RepID=UPI0013D4C8AC|nr:nicotinate-nucleotide--dimethylbenzimidazole phosphoribosyltransferase [Fodinicola acaciae]
MTAEQLEDNPFDGLAIDLPDLAAFQALHGGSSTVDRPYGDLAAGLRWVATVRGGRRSPFERIQAVVLAADHGIAAHRVSVYEPAVSTERTKAALSGASPLNLLAEKAGARLAILDVGLDAEPLGEPSAKRIRRGSGVLGAEDALTADEVAAAIGLGRSLADTYVDEGADLIVPCVVGVGSSTPAATLVAAVLGDEPAAMTGRGSGIDDNAWMRKCAAIRDGLRRARSRPADPAGMLAAAGGVDIAVTTGLVLQAAHRRTPVLLDGLTVLAAALVASEVSYAGTDWWWAPQAGDDPAETKATDALHLTDPAGHLKLRLGDGAGALAVVPLLQSLLTLAART